jgi:hypothetical protein
MKRVELKDVKPGYYWLKDADDGSFDPVRVYEDHTGKLQYLFVGSECESPVDNNDRFFEMVVPVEGEINLLRNEYDSESIVDMSRDISESLDSDFNPSVNLIPEMEDFPGFWAGRFVVDITWKPDDEQ